MGTTKIYTHGDNGLCITWEGTDGQKWAFIHDPDIEDPMTGSTVDARTCYEDCALDFVTLAEQHVNPIADG